MSTYDKKNSEPLNDEIGGYMVPPPPPPRAHSGQKLLSLVSRLTKKIAFLLFLLVLLTGGAASYFYRRLSALESDPQIKTQREVADLIAQVSKIFLLPTGETPTVAVVVDPAKLKDQPFFVNAQKNDKVLIYGNAREAILYDPSANKIINIAPVYFQNQNQSTADTVSVPGSPTPAPTSTDTLSNRTKK